MKKPLIFIICTFTLMGASEAMAQQNWPEEPKPYVSLEDAVVFLNDSTFSNTIAPVQAEFDTGFGITGAIGYDLGFTRLELEAAYRSNDFDKLEAANVNVSGEKMTALGGMVNLFFDFHNRTRCTPYVGAGIGGMALDVEDLRINGKSIDDAKDGVFAYQAMAGFSIEVIPRFQIDVSYRYFATSDANFDGIKAEYESHNLMAGFRYSLF
jgi:opacity protein-like surface antigen